MSCLGMGFPHSLTENEWRECVDLWNHGFDTKDIALAAGVRESFIYNRLPRLRLEYANAQD